jgi:DNA invertase Pin-like site-specific DNA recombinase
MSRPTKKIEIPYHPTKSISELLEEGKTHKEIADSFGVGRSTITERIKKEKNAECRKIIKDRMEREK